MGSQYLSILVFVNNDSCFVALRKVEKLDILIDFLAELNYKNMP
jgi:hypothetical protein